MIFYNLIAQMKELLIYSLVMILTMNTSTESGKTSLDVTSNPNTNYILKDSNKITILNNYNQINSITELLKPFKNKPVFIDLWATWCEPCVEEFKYSKPLYEYLTKNGIEIIYVSFDKEKDDSAWREKLSANELFGNHVRASKSLRDSLTTLIWGGINASSLPNYLLFNKEGKVVNKSSLHPSTGIKLFNQIKSDLKEN
jgi:thiol-disulfide isomerase/thioredoxin